VVPLQMISGILAAKFTPG